MNEDGMMMFASESTPTTQLIVTWDSPTGVDPDVRNVHISVEVEDVDAAYISAQTAGYEIVRAVQNEPWGIRRFFVRDPAGQVMNLWRVRALSSNRRSTDRSRGPGRSRRCRWGTDTLLLGTTSPACICTTSVPETEHPVYR